MKMCKFVLELFKTCPVLDTYFVVGFFSQSLSDRLDRRLVKFFGMC